MRKSNCGIDDQGNLNDYLGVNVRMTNDGVLLTQPHLIYQIIKDTVISTRTQDKLTPVPSTIILSNDPNGKAYDRNFDYRSVIGKLNFLEKSTRPNITYAVHQCARFCSNSKKSHGDAVVHLVKYLRRTKTNGLLLKPNNDKGFEVYADANFSGSWIRSEAELDPTTTKSRTGFIIKYTDCILTWRSKLQTTIALSSTEAEYVSLSQAMREAIPIMGLLDELADKKIIPNEDKTKVQCKVFEDNLGAIELARLPKMRPRM